MTTPEERLRQPPRLHAGRPPQWQGHRPDLEAAGQIGQRQVVHEGAWPGWLVGCLGFAWPFAVALFAVGLTAAGIDFSDRLAYLLLQGSFLGTPLVVTWFYRRLPASWPEACRLLVALLLAAPCVLIQLY